VSTERFLEILDRHGPWVIILLLAVLSTRVVWRDLIIPFRDRLLAVLTSWGTFLADLNKRMEQDQIRAIMMQREQETQGDMIGKVYEVVQEVQDSCERIEANQTDSPPRAPRQRSRIIQPGQSGPPTTSPGSTP
jgi:hypothetical protein